MNVECIPEVEKVHELFKVLTERVCRVTGHHEVVTYSRRDVYHLPSTMVRVQLLDCESVRAHNFLERYHARRELSRIYSHTSDEVARQEAKEVLDNTGFYGAIRRVIHPQKNKWKS